MGTAIFHSDWLYYTYYFYSSVEIFESVASCTEFVYDKAQINQHGSANAS